METTNLNPNKLWTSNELADYLQVSPAKIRHDVMLNKIPCIRIGRSVRFDKKVIEQFFKIEIKEDEKPPVSPLNKKQRLISINDTVAWLTEKSTLFPFAEINIRVIIHERKIKRIERTITEKIQD
jgi:excisionase family DNA binding protein